MLLRILSLWMLGVVCSWGIIIADPTGASQYVPPSDDPGFYNVGTIVGQGTGVYIGNIGGQHWVMTANHVGGGTFRNWQTGSTYSMIAGTYRQLRNADNSLTDLGVFQISGDPGLPSLNISASTPTIGSSLVMVGAGRAQETTLTSWNNSWVEGGNPATRFGYKYLSPANYPLAWGTNNLDSTTTSSIGGLSVRTMRMDFDNPGSFGTANYEGMAATGDSGGAIFYKSAGGQWELAGLILAISTLGGQPGQTAVFGNATIAADLSFYRSQILTAVPEPSTYFSLVAGISVLLLVLRRRAKQSGL
jgi:hypothetical protein